MAGFIREEAPLKIVLISLALMIAQPTLAKTNALRQALLRELGCRSAPNPTPIINSLAKDRLIGLADQRRYGGVTCWRLRQALDLKGLVVTEVCSAEGNYIVRKKYPKIYVQIPRGSWETLIAVKTNTDEIAAMSWAGSNLRGGKSRVEKIRSPNRSTQIYCSNLYQ